MVFKLEQDVFVLEDSISRVWTANTPECRD